MAALSAPMSANGCGGEGSEWSALLLAPVSAAAANDCPSGRGIVSNEKMRKMADAKVQIADARNVCQIWMESFFIETERRDAKSP